MASLANSNTWHLALSVSQSIEKGHGYGCHPDPAGDRSFGSVTDLA
jgi:hypothetical protein